ncbi:hypothetical protein FRACA_3960007 [Frankia canadensis]|uniref:Uncharacterized protein n=1 Tax=Frankia canadensis TaxID=1836972 RepID=A0A2I2KWD3_9ACTN|nr:hypothetical protein FRACA_3960007 [Frankia canadensis]SOU57250.1 hypothetical protein FRACA_3960007 [Frankia canadensis]
MKVLPKGRTFQDESAPRASAHWRLFHQPPQPARPRRTRAAAADHPHGRREDILTAFDDSDANGAPPRAWGGRPRGPPWPPWPDQPPGVGRTSSSASPRSSASDHPHVAVR